MASTKQVNKWMQQCLGEHLNPDVLRVTAADDSSSYLWVQKTGTTHEVAEIYRLTITSVNRAALDTNEETPNAHTED